MANGTIAVDEGTAKLLQTFLNLVAGQNVHAEGVVLVGPDGVPITSTNKLPVLATLRGDGTSGGMVVTGSGTLSVPPGAAVRGYAFRSGFNGDATVVIPGVTGTVPLAGGPRISSTVEDDYLTGELIGPCDFVYTNVATGIVRWAA